MEQQRLIYRGKVLRDDQVISSYNVQNGDALHLVRTVPGMSYNGSSSSRPGVSHRTGIDGISPGIQREIPNATETLLSRYLNRIRREYILNRTNMNEILGTVFNPSAPSQGIPEVEQLARLLSSNRDMLINQTSQLFLDFEGDLLQNLNVNDLRMRSRTMQTVQMMFEYVGRDFLELGRAIMQVQTRLIGIQYDLYLDGLRQRQHSARSLLQTRSSISDEDLAEFFFQKMPSQHQHEQASATIRQQNNTELADVHESATPGATTDNVTENMGTSDSSEPSIAENRSALESSIEPSDENN